jgi:peptidoglycan hydrolase-like protein with peptidoglycan-binding domain
MAPYQQAGLLIQRGCNVASDVIRALQRDLRALGYLRSGIDGAFGPGTEAALRALQFDLLHNAGASTGGDGAAPVAITAFNGTPAAPAVAEVNGVMDQALADCIARMLADPRVPQLPCCDNPATENGKALAAIAASTSSVAPVPFISAIVRQESGGMHFQVPGHASNDNFIVVGVDHNAGNADQISSRGYGIGQYTLFHHPPRPEEIKDFMLDPVRNVQKAQIELRDKFDKFVVGPADKAADRLAEHPLLALRPCRYAVADPRYLRDCRNCANSVRKISIAPGTPLYAGCADSFQPTQYYGSATYIDVPERAGFLCDWPYAVRRYNGSGVNSFHYQTRVLQILAALPSN